MLAGYTAALIGFPSVGKSTLMSRLTGQHSEAAAYEFTTLTSVPGQVTYNGMLRICRTIGSWALRRRTAAWVLDLEKELVLCETA